MSDLAHKRRDRDHANLDSALNVMFLAIFPMLLWAFSGTFAGIATSLLVIWLFSLALRLIGKGQRLERKYNSSIVARRPRFPRKILGSALIGVVVVILAGHHFTDLMLPLVTGLLAAALSLVAFGLDPMQDKGLTDPHLSRQMETAAALEAIEARLDHFLKQINDLGDVDVSRKTETSCDLVISLLRRNVQDSEKFKDTLHPANDFAERLEDEIDALKSKWAHSSREFSRERYLMKLEIMTECFTESITKTGQTPRAKDRFSRKAERLLEQMPAESAA
jgi:hypothetical protein